MRCSVCNKNKKITILKKDMVDKIYPLVRCTSCRHVFIDPMPTQESLSDYYNSDYAVPLYQQKKVKRKAREISRVLNNLGVTKKSKLVDIGASHGFFLNEMKKRGFIPYGVELSKKAVKNAKTQFGLKVENKLFDKSTLAKKRNYFDVADMLDVIEHLREPGVMVEDISKTLKKGGRLIITTPNIDSLEFKLYGRHWEWLSPPAHLNYFSQDSIETLFDKYGLDVEYSITYRGDSAGNILFHAYLALRQLVFYSLKYFIGKKRLLKMRQNVGCQIDESAAKLGKEFTGLSGTIYFITELFNPLLKPFENYRNNKGKGASLLVVGKKR